MSKKKIVSISLLLGLIITGALYYFGLKYEGLYTVKRVNGIQMTLNLDNDSSENEVLDAMHKMTHQKVRAEEKWGASPMTKSTIHQVYILINNSSFPRREKMLEILERWKRGDFSRVAEDHNYIWNVQGGNVGKAYGVMTKEEELEFIQKNFRK